MPLFAPKHKDDCNTHDAHRHEGGIHHGHPHAYNDGVPGNTTAGTGTQEINAYDNSVRTPYPGVPTGVPNIATPTRVHDNNNHPTRGTTGTKLAGKFESVLGSMVGSNTLKAKGLEKERAANVANLQGLNSLELSEAERLEREALMRRQKVAGQGHHHLGHGAHPANSNPAAGQFDAGIGSTQSGGYRQ